MSRIIGVYSTYATDEDVREFAAAAPGFEVRRLTDPLTEADVADCEVLLGFIPPAVLKGARQLRWLCAQSAGVNQFTAPGTFCRDGVMVTNSSGAYGVPIAEHLMAMTLMMLRRMPYYMQRQRDRYWGTWKDEGEMFASLCGSVVTVVGLGDIGTRYAQLVKPFGATVRGVRRTNAGKPDGVDELYLESELDKALAGADVIALCLPGTAGTTGIMTRERLMALKPGCFFLNIGRGSLVDEGALIEALQTGIIRAAGLDVTAVEPLPQDSPLWGMDNVILTPHISGTMSPITNAKIIGLFKDNLVRYVAGERLVNLVDLKQGY